MFGIPYLGTPLQGITAAILAILGGLGVWYIRGWPERTGGVAEAKR